MIVYDKEQKEIVIPNGIGNINLFNNGVEAGYNQGKIDGIDEQKSKLESINITENGTYRKEDGYNEVVVNVPDLNGSYSEGYEQGKIDGIDEQKAKLESINITENGVYSKEDGYNHIEVNVVDLNGSYEEGYQQGQADIATNARVLDVTENGNYLSKFSDPILPTLVTGVYADGTKFYNYAELNGKVFNTKIAATKDSRIELWWKNDGSYVELGAIIGAQNDNIFKFVEFLANEYRIEYGYPYGGSFFAHNFTYDMSSKWNHIIFSKQDGLNVNGELICEIQGEGWRENAAISNFWINASYNGEVSINANGYFGMIKIDDVVIIPTADGFLNTNTGELLEVVQDGGYTFRENDPIYGEGELYKTINVNVLPKVNVKEAGLKFGYSIFTEVPDWADFEGITDMNDMFTWCENLQTIPLIDTSNVIQMTYMFNNCTNLQTIPLLDTSNVIYMGSMFYKCPNLQTIPLLDTSNVINMSFMFYNCNSLQTIPQLDTSNVIDMSYMFCYCENLQTIPLIDTSNVINMDCMFRDCPNLQTIPPLNTSKVTTMESMFGECRKLTSIPALNAQSLNIPSYIGIFGYSELPNITDFGGFLNLKSSLTNDNNLQRLPNLTKESCINVLNGLYDFTGNGETPNSEQGQLKVAQSFIDKVGDEISIGINKGWSITAG